MELAGERLRLQGCFLHMKEKNFYISITMETMGQVQCRIHAALENCEKLQMQD